MLLFVFRSAPYQDCTAREGLEAALAAAAFDQAVRLLFIDDGVYQLTNGQNPEHQKNLQKMLAALPIYDVNEIFVHQYSLEERGLSPHRLNLTAQPVTNVDTTRLIGQATHVLSF